ncbi:hypothetical protein ABDK00_001470 [Niabella insulamsoli]|uniref:hypothetical protein n=1 Tax=Niabella insulamsoli TaxID=3144874 RepID=UPI0031FC97DE
MTSDELKRDFINWVESLSNESFPSHPLLNAGLEEESELFLNSTIDGVSFIDLYPEPERYRVLFEQWARTCLRLLKLPEQGPHVTINFRGAFLGLPPEEVKEQLLLLHQLSGQCLSESDLT